jgi:S-adenosylmethionine synthetase
VIHPATQRHWVLILDKYVHRAQLDEKANMNYLDFTSESVAAGHPDKICDQISDAILDAAITVDKKSRVGVETLATFEKIAIAREVTCGKPIEYEKIARNVVKELGYTKPEFNFSYKSDVEVLVHQQSADIALGVDLDGAGDQGMMFGYAVDETTELMPLPITLAHRLVEQMDKMRESKTLPYLRPDGKSEVKVKYKNGVPVGVDSVVIAVPNDPDISKERLTHDLYKKVVVPVLLEYGYKLEEKEFIVNGTGKWEIGGPASDTGLTGRKIIVDSYGGMARIGGGAMSGKDPSKVDRSAAYAARYVAKNVVAHKLADRCEVQLAYVIGYPKPITTAIETFGTEKTSMKVITDLAFNKLLDLSVKGIVEGLDLRRPIYRKTARYGHFGRVGFPWEEIANV